MFKKIFIAILLISVCFFYIFFKNEHFSTKECNNLNKLHPPQFEENKLKRYITTNGTICKCIKNKKNVLCNCITKHPINSDEIYNEAKTGGRIIDYAFTNCSFSKGFINFDNNNISVLGKSAFSKIFNLKHISFKNCKISLINEKCFESCINLKSIDFSNNKSESIIIKKPNIIYNDIYKYKDCYNVDDNNQIFCRQQARDIYFRKEKEKFILDTTNWSKPYCQIKSNAFNNCTKLEKIILPPIQILTNNLFNNLYNLTTVIFDNSGINLQIIGTNCFTNTGLKELSLKECNTLTLKTDSFKNCKQLKYIFIKKINNLTIEPNAFSNCNSINIVSSSVKNIKKLKPNFKGNKIYLIDDNLYSHNRNKIINKGIDIVKGISNRYINNLEESYSTFKYIYGSPYLNIITQNEFDANIKLIRSNGDIKDAVNLWIKDSNKCIEKYGNIENWITVNVTDMSQLFNKLTSFNSNISKWDTRNVISMEEMFFDCTSFDSNINTWIVNNVITMKKMFHGCENFNQDLNQWDTRNVINMNSMFKNCKLFNKELKYFITYKVQDMESMFYGTVKFNNPINRVGIHWDTSNVLTMKNMFNNASQFNQNLNWDVSNVTDMSYMFYNATNFNQNLNQWDTRNVINMNSNFFYNTYFSIVNSCNNKCVTSKKSPFYKLLKKKLKIKNTENLEQTIEINLYGEWMEKYSYITYTDKDTEFIIFQVKENKKGYFVFYKPIDIIIELYIDDNNNIIYKYDTNYYDVSQ